MWILGGCLVLIVYHTLWTWASPVAGLFDKSGAISVNRVVLKLRWTTCHIERVAPGRLLWKQGLIHGLRSREAQEHVNFYKGPTDKCPSSTSTVCWWREGVLLVDLRHSDCCWNNMKAICDFFLIFFFQKQPAANNLHPHSETVERIDCSHFLKALWSMQMTLHVMIADRHRHRSFVHT